MPSAELEAGRSGVRHYGPAGETTPEDLVDTPLVRVFVESWAPPPQMWIFGAVDFTAALAKVAKVLGYRVTVCDAREIFATRRRFPMADEVRVTWPGRCSRSAGDELGPRDAVCILTHDPKFDVPAVQGALATTVGYIGVMGSRNTHDRRLERLAEAGTSDPAELDRLIVTDRSRSGRPHTRGDGDLDLCRDHRSAHGPGRTVAARRVGPDPPVAAPTATAQPSADENVETAGTAAATTVSSFTGSPNALVRLDSGVTSTLRPCVGECTMKPWPTYIDTWPG